MRAILQTLPGLIGELRGSEVREAIVLAMWPSAVGEPLRDISAPIRLENKLLFVAVPSREWKREFGQHAGSIVYKLNATLKTSVVERLEFVIDAGAIHNSNVKVTRRRSEGSTIVSKDVAAAASEIKDLELRNNFLKAAAACMERRDAGAK